jgi:hypothetical protein
MWLLYQINSFFAVPLRGFEELPEGLKERGPHHLKTTNKFCNLKIGTKIYVPLRGFEPLFQAPEARVLSIELQGQAYNQLYLKTFEFRNEKALDCS